VGDAKSAGRRHLARCGRGVWASPSRTKKIPTPSGASVFYVGVVPCQRRSFVTRLNNSRRGTRPSGGQLSEALIFIKVPESARR
jgi:hypothetical protein